MRYCSRAGPAQYSSAIAASPSRSIRSAKAKQLSSNFFFSTGSVLAPLPAAAAVSDRVMPGWRMPNSNAAVAPIDSPTRCAPWRPSRQHCSGIICGARLRIGGHVIAQIGGRPTASGIGDAAIAPAEMAKLRLPAQVMAAELVHEQDWVAFPGFLDIELDAIISADHRHRSHPQFRCRQGGAPVRDFSTCGVMPTVLPPMHDTAHLPISQVSTMLEVGRVDAVALTRHCLERAAETADTLNCFITLCADAALAEARMAAARAQGRSAARAVGWGSGGR